jgi:hypothetical protein
MERSIAVELDQAVDFAEKGSWQPIEDLLLHVGAESRAP